MLKSLDKVFNPKEASNRTQSDLERGITSNTPLFELQEKSGKSIHLSKMANRENLYLLFEITSEKDGQKNSGLFIRGFEGANFFHSEVAQVFGNELFDYHENESLYRWPFDARDNLTRSLIFEREGYKVILTIIGGRKYILSSFDSNLRFFGASNDFEIVPDEFKERERELLNQLLEKEPCKGLQIHM